MLKRRVFALLLFSALVSPKASIASGIGCNIQDSDGTIRNVGYRISSGAINSALFAGGLAGAAFGLGIVSAPVAVTIFVGINVLSFGASYISTVGEQTDILEAAVKGF